MRKAIIFMALFSALNAYGATEKFCDEIRRFRVWSGGSDTNGIWVELNKNPEACPGGFWLQHAGQNKDYVMSFLLAEKAQGNKVCIQAVTSALIGNRCRINQVYNP